MGVISTIVCAVVHAGVGPRHKSVVGAVQRLDLMMRCNIPVRSCVEDMGEIVEQQVVI